MSSTTYDHLRDDPKLYTTDNHFVNVNKMVHHRGNFTAMVRNAGQLPQPFWLGAAHGSGSCSAAQGPARI